MRLLAVAGLLLLATGSSAAIRHVAPGGSADVGTCLSSTSPCATLTYAIAQAVPGDEVLAAPGTYSRSSGEAFPIRVKRGVVLRSSGGAPATTIRNDGSGVDVKSVLLHFEGRGELAPTGISGFTIDGVGAADNQYGIAIEALGNAPETGEPSPFVRDCRLLGFSRAALQLIVIGFGGVPVSLTALVERNHVSDSAIGISLATYAMDGATSMSESSQLQNNVIVGCHTGLRAAAERDTGAVARPSGTGVVQTRLRHLTVLGSSSDAVVVSSDDGFVGEPAVRLDVANSIFAGSARFGIREDVGDGDPRFREADVTRLAANCFHGNAGGDYFDLDSGMVYTGAVPLGGIPDLGGASSNNLDADPAADPVEGWLGPASPCIDRADAALSVADDVDADPRPAGPASDIGADEYYPRLRRGAFLSIQPPLFPDKAVLLPALPAYRSLWLLPFTDPEAGLLDDAGRPLIVYQVAGASKNTLRLVKEPVSRSVTLYY